MTGRVGTVGRALGYAGLLPQVAAVGLMLVPGYAAVGFVVALLYGALILSFLGGIWWAFAMRRAVGQARLAAIAVAPSLVAFAILGLNVLAVIAAVAALILLGVALALTLAVDRLLVRSGEAPAGWLQLRVPLSLGLGGLTLVAALLARNVPIL